MKKTRGQRTANERLKRTYCRNLAIGLIAAVMGHSALFAVFPDMAVEDLRASTEDMEAVALTEEPPKVELPPPPERILRPATPKVASVPVAEEITIAPTTFESNRPESPGPPPRVVSGPPKGPRFIPYDVAPKLENREEIQQILEDEYPTNLRQARVGGKVVLWILVSVEGRVVQSQVKVSSGHSELDQAAHRVASAMLFEPAMNRDKKTAVWVQQVITFQVET